MRKSRIIFRKEWDKDKKSIIRENSKANILNKEVLSVEKWNEKSILNRAKMLSGILIRKFNYVEMHSDIDVAHELSFGVDSDIDVSNTKPAGFAFAGEYTKVSSWVELLTKFINLAYDLNSEGFRYAQPCIKSNHQGDVETGAGREALYDMVPFL